MKQIIQSFKTGETILEEIPAPQVKRGTVLIQTTRSLVSLGTERMLVEFGKSNLIQKSRQQPDKVKQVLDKIKTEGLMPTLEAVFNKLGEPLPLGYCKVSARPTTCLISERFSYNSVDTGLSGFYGTEPAFCQTPVMPRFY